MVIKGELKTLGSSTIKANGLREYQYIEIGEYRTRRVWVDQLPDEYLRDALGQNVELSFYKSRLWGWRGMGLLALKLSDGRVIKTGSIGEYIKLLFYYLLETTLLIGFPGGWLEFFLTDTMVHPSNGQITITVIVVLTVVAHRFMRYLKIRNAFGKENFGALKRI